MNRIPHSAFFARTVAALCALVLSAPLAAVDMKKVVRQVLPAAETGFDPAAAHDLYSATIEQAMFETLLTYDYLARPAKLVPLSAEAIGRSSGRIPTTMVFPA